jgi:hypothetical protein
MYFLGFSDKFLQLDQPTKMTCEFYAICCKVEVPEVKYMALTEYRSCSGLKIIQGLCYIFRVVVPIKLNCSDREGMWIVKAQNVDTA